MPCYLLHIMEDPDRDAYRDPDLRDVVGLMPKFFCAHCDPVKQVLPSEGLRCIRAVGPCWKPADRICDQEPASSAPSLPLAGDSPVL